jgi:hypothetical protein
MDKFLKKTCKRHGLTEFVLEGRGSYRCKKCRSLAVSNRRKRNKIALVEHFGGKCVKCGYSKYIGALSFHHLDPSQKDFKLSSGDTRSLSKLIVEAKKCILVCNNCHAEIHGEGNGYG